MRLFFLQARLFNEAWRKNLPAGKGREAIRCGGVIIFQFPKKKAANKNS